MEDKSDVEKVDDVMLPGFRFHPTDEELVGFYLKRKIQQRSLPIELIKQVDIYKYDPWDLPKLATTGEKEWYFYCPRDRKYRNSARPNRVTGSGFWKATGTDRPIYSSDGTKCIGLKKSLVFYRGRAAKGMKTDWMMHEFRLPSITDSAPPKKFLDKNIAPNDSWAICRIFKKTNSMAQRALSHSWVTQLPEPIGSDLLGHGAQYSQFSSENISCTTEIGSAINHPNSASFNSMDVQSYRPMLYPPVSKASTLTISNSDLPSAFIFSPLDMPPGPTKCTADTSPMLMCPALMGGEVNKPSESISFEGSHQFIGFSIGLPHEMQGNIGGEEEAAGLKKNPALVHANNQWPATTRSMGFPFSLPSNMPWDSPPCPSEMSTAFSTNKCYN